MAARTRKEAAKASWAQMTAEVIPIPRMHIAEARQIIACPEIHDTATVLNACELLAQSDGLPRIRAGQLHAALARSAVAEINRRQRIMRGLAIAGDFFGAVGLFGILYLLLIFTPG
jgi:hypothetical protein